MLARPHIFTFSPSRLLQLCPATCTLLSLSYRWSSKLSWRQIPTLSEYYHRSASHHHCAVRWKACDSCLLLAQSLETLCRGQGAWKPMWAANILVCIYSDSDDSVMRVAACNWLSSSIPMVVYHLLVTVYMYTYNINPQAACGGMWCSQSCHRRSA